MNSTRRNTIQQLLQSAPPPQSEIELLAAHVLHRPREFVVAHPEYGLTRWQAYRLSQLIKRRLNGIPLAYLTGRKEFFGLNFAVNKDVLIPRPETELLVKLTIDRIRNNELAIAVSGVPPRGGRIKNKIIMIDVGTGSGCIPISIMKTLEHAFVPSSGRGKNMKTVTYYATDISRQALRVAKQNAAAHGIDITFLKGNLLDPIIKLAQRSLIIDHRSQTNDHCSLFTDHCSLIITANLPYLTESWYQSESSIQHEPKQALVADHNDGLSLYRKLLEQINALVPCSMLHVTCLIEIDPRQTAAMQKLIHDILPAAAFSIHKDLAGHDRAVVINLKSSVFGHRSPSQSQTYDL